jgi:hypothetical protein
MGLVNCLDTSKDSRTLRGSAGTQNQHKSSAFPSPCRKRPQSSDRCFYRLYHWNYDVHEHHLLPPDQSRRRLASIYCTFPWYHLHLQRSHWTRPSQKCSGIRSECSVEFQRLNCPPPRDQSSANPGERQVTPSCRCTRQIYQRRCMPFLPVIAFRKLVKIGVDHT